MPLCLDMFLCFILTCHQFGLQRTKSSRGVQWREARACRCFRARRFITLPLLGKVTYRKEKWRALPPFSSRVIPISLHNERIVNSLTSLIRQQELHDVMLTQRNTQAMSHSLSDWAFYRFALFTEESAITNSLSKIVLVDNIGHPCCSLNDAVIALLFKNQEIFKAWPSNVFYLITYSHYEWVARTNQE